MPGIIWLFAKILFFFFLFSWVKATVPRYRYDQLMRLGWKIFLPLSLFWVFLVSGFSRVGFSEYSYNVLMRWERDLCQLGYADNMSMKGRAICHR